MDPNGGDQSQVSLKLYSNLNEQSATAIGTSKANISVVAPSGSSSPQRLKYENEKEKFIRKAQAAISKGKDVQLENHYNLRNYRLDNKKLAVSMPGEKKA